MKIFIFVTINTNKFDSGLKSIFAKKKKNTFEHGRNRTFVLRWNFLILFGKHLQKKVPSFTHTSEETLPGKTKTMNKKKKKSKTFSKLDMTVVGKSKIESESNFYSIPPVVD